MPSRAKAFEAHSPRETNELYANLSMLFAKLSRVLPSQIHCLERSRLQTRRM